VSSQPCSSSCRTPVAELGTRRPIDVMGVTVALILASGACGPTGAHPSGRGRDASPDVVIPDSGVEAALDPFDPRANRNAFMAALGSRTCPRASAESAALDDATFDRRVFRELDIGYVHYPGARYTWVLLRSRTRTRLRVLSQYACPPRTSPGLRLDGGENDERSWDPPCVVEYVGGRLGQPLRRPIADTEPRCRFLREVITLDCRPAKVKVRPAGAVAIPDDSDSDGGRPPHWRPAKLTEIGALRCRVRERRPEDNPLVFAAPTGRSPGIEWAYEDSDMAVKAGTYRFMPAPP
jgi:hypothetical protein